MNAFFKTPLGALVLTTTAVDDQFFAATKSLFSPTFLAGATSLLIQNDEDES